MPNFDEKIAAQLTSRVRALEDLFESTRIKIEALPEAQCALSSLLEQLESLYEEQEDHGSPAALAQEVASLRAEVLDLRAKLELKMPSSKAEKVSSSGPEGRRDIVLADDDRLVAVNVRLARQILRIRNNGRSLSGSCNVAAVAATDLLMLLDKQDDE